MGKNDVMTKPPVPSHIKLVVVVCLVRESDFPHNGCDQAAGWENPPKRWRLLGNPLKMPNKNHQSLEILGHLKKTNLDPPK